MTATPSEKPMPATGADPAAVRSEPPRENPMLRHAEKATLGGGIFPRTVLLVGGVALAAVALLVVAGSLLGFIGAKQDEGMVFVIPAGINVERPGFDSAIAIPTDIRFQAGEPAVITVRNLDDETQRAGPFLVGAGQTYVQRFPEPGNYPIACSVNPLESVVVTVEA